MDFPSQARFLEMLGWTLLNSLWVFGIVWIVYLLLVWVLPKLSAANRYNLALLLLLTGVGWSFFYFILCLLEIFQPAFRIGNFATENNFISFYHVSAIWIQQALPFVTLIYLFWLTAKLFRFSRVYFWNNLSLKNSLNQKVPVAWRLYMQEMSEHMNIGRQIQFLMSSKIDSPLISGWLKPVILLPLTAINHLTTDQVEAILIHELAHIKRNDYIWNILVTLTDILFFFNPYARKLVRKIQEERENACDDWVLQFPIRPDQYALALLSLEKQRQVKFSLVLTAGGGTKKLLLERVKRMLYNEPRSKVESSKYLARLLGSGIMVLVFGLISIQPRLAKPVFLADSQIAPSLAINGSEFEKTFQFEGMRGNVLATSLNQNKSKSHNKTRDRSPIIEHKLTKEQDIKLPVLAVAQVLLDDANITTNIYLKEELDFTMPLPRSPELPSAALYSNTLPYTPRSSFEAYYQVDSTQLAEKVKAFRESGKRKNSASNPKGIKIIVNI